MVIKLVTLLDSLTKFSESFVLGLFDIETGFTMHEIVIYFLAMIETKAVTASTGEIDVELCCSTSTELLDDQLVNKEAAELETNEGDTHLTCNLDG